MKTTMQTKLFVLFAAAGLSIASAKTFSIMVPDNSVIAGNPVKAGEYTVKVDGTTATLTDGDNKKLQVTGTSETADTKFSQTTVQSSQGDDGKNHIKEIDLGGTKTKIEFGN